MATESSSVFQSPFIRKLSDICNLDNYNPSKNNGKKLYINSVVNLFSKSNKRNNVLKSY